MGELGRGYLSKNTEKKVLSKIITGLTNFTFSVYFVYLLFLPEFVRCVLTFLQLTFKVLGVFMKQINNNNLTL